MVSQIELDDSKVIDSTYYHNCDEAKYNEFSNLTINGFSILEFNLNSFLKEYPNYDTVIDGYIYYDKSHFLFSDGELITVQVLDNSLYFDGFLSFDEKVENIKNKFPCSYIRRTKTEFYNETCEVVTLYDVFFNSIDIYISSDKILGIVYSINESDFDIMNR